MKLNKNYILLIKNKQGTFLKILLNNYMQFNKQIFRTICLKMLIALIKKSCLYKFFFLLTTVIFWITTKITFTSDYKVSQHEISKLKKKSLNDFSHLAVNSEQDQHEEEQGVEHVGPWHHGQSYRVSFKCQTGSCQNISIK